MKKLFVIFLFVIAGLTSFAQNPTGKQYIPWLKSDAITIPGPADDATQAGYFIWHGDTIDFTMLTDSTIVYEQDSTVLFITLKQLVDSLNALPGGHSAVTIGANGTTAGLSITGQELNMQSATAARNGYLTAIDFSNFYSKLSLVVHTNLLSGNGTTVSPLSINTDSIAKRSWVLAQNYINENQLHYDSLAGLPTLPVIENIAFDAGWDGDLDGASKNVIYDAIAALPGGHDELTLSDSASAGGLSLTGQLLDFQRATASQNGFITYTDWLGFNAFRLDSARLLHWSDTLNTTKGIATPYDVNVVFKNLAYKNVVMYGAVGDSATDNTTVLQNLFDDGGNIYFPDGVYIVGPLTLSSNTNILMSAGAKLVAKTGYGANDRLLNIVNVSNVNIDGNGSIIQMLKSEYSTGEQRHCVNISQSTNIKINNLTLKDSGGDGIYIGGGSDYPSRNIMIVNCTSDNNRRQGMSITNVVDCFVLGGVYKNTNGTSPESGIDIEPNNYSGYYIQNVNIDGVKTENNAGAGILITPQYLTTPMSINVINCESYNDGRSTWGALYITSSAGTTKAAGSININNMKIFNPKGSGITVTKWNQNSADVIIENSYVLNPGSDPTIAALSDLNKCGFVFSSQTLDNTTSYGYVNIDGLKIEDNRETIATLVPIYILNNTAYPTKNIYLKNIDVTHGEWTLATTNPMVINSSASAENIKVDYVNDAIYESASFTLTSAYIGTKISAITTSGFTLPLASTVNNCEFEFVQKNSGYVIITPNAADSILGYTSIGSGLISREPGSTLRLKSFNNNWIVTDINGKWGLKNYYGMRMPMTANTAAPTTGTWKKGDIIYNYSPTTTGKIGWVCTTAGTPGTWTTFGQIGDITLTADSTSTTFGITATGGSRVHFNRSSTTPSSVISNQLRNGIVADRNIDLTIADYTPTDKDVLKVIADDDITDGDSITLSINGGDSYTIFDYPEHDKDYILELMFLDNAWYVMTKMGEEAALKGNVDATNLIVDTNGIQYVGLGEDSFTENTLVPMWWVLQRFAADNNNTQTLVGTTPYWNVVNGKNAEITLTGTTTITFSNLTDGDEGTLYVTNGGSTSYRITFAGYNVEIYPSVWYTGDEVSVSGSTKKDVFTYKYIGGTINKVVINGALDLK